MSATPDHPGALNWLLILSLGVIWGAAFMLVSLSLEGFGPLSVAAGRVLIGGLILCAFGTMIGQGLHSIPSAPAFGAAAVIGLFTIALPISLLSWGQQFVPSAFAGVAMGAVPLLVLPLVALFSPEEGIGPRRIAGLLLGFVGLVVLIGPDAFRSETETQNLAAQLACLGAACCYACGSVMTRRAPKMPPLAFAAASLIVAALALVPLALVLEGMPATLQAGPLTALLCSALFPTALAAVIRVHVITTAGSLFMSLTSYQVPIWSVIFGVTFMNEALPTRLYAALLLILGGIALSQSRALAPLFKRS